MQLMNSSQLKTITYDFTLAFVRLFTETG